MIHTIREELESSKNHPIRKELGSPWIHPIRKELRIDTFNQEKAPVCLANKLRNELQKLEDLCTPSLRAKNNVNLTRLGMPPVVSALTVIITI